MTAALTDAPPEGSFRGAAETTRPFCRLAHTEKAVLWPRFSPSPLSGSEVKVKCHSREPPRRPAPGSGLCKKSLEGFMALSEVGLALKTETGRKTCVPTRLWANYSESHHARQFPVIPESWRGHLRMARRFSKTTSCHFSPSPMISSFPNSSGNDSMGPFRELRPPPPGNMLFIRCRIAEGCGAEGGRGSGVL